MAESKENDREMVKYKLNKFHKLSYRNNPKKTVLEMTDPRFLQASAGRIRSEIQPEKERFETVSCRQKAIYGSWFTKEQSMFPTRS